MKNISAVILAAGEGTRMNSNYPKILHKLGSKPMLGHVMDNVQIAGVKDIFVITGYKSELVENFVADKASCVPQKKLLGTGDAVWQIKDKPSLNQKNARLLVIYGDTPLITSSTIKKLLQKHMETEASCTLLTVTTKDPTGYGRVVRNDGGTVVKIVEEQDATVFERAIEEINVGVYVFKAEELFTAIKKIKPDNAKREYYLTDVIEVLNKQNLLVNSVETQDHDEILGVNSRQGLARAYAIYKMRILEDIVAAGVTVLDPQTTFIDEKVKIGRDTVIYPYTVIECDVVIGENCSIGPFCRIRSGCDIGNNVCLGNFVEINRSSVGVFSRIKHQSYIGDTTIEENVNIGAGTIVANYDGKNKNKTIIKSGAFIGTGTILVAPVKIGKGAMTGAGAVVTKNKDVPDKAVVVGVPAKIFKKQKGK
ncbi:MAG: NTP transferase domain-containing protein [Candidatus Omnitrophica bacterium]|nr:NTP transferase domain-containing protein [Candidatus Omnitrophota bacterium]MCG2702826.1 NTP transferase domain-containing protein [Candidatus Omnitrophota bacterium]